MCVYACNLRGSAVATAITSRIFWSSCYLFQKFNFLVLFEPQRPRWCTLGSQACCGAVFVLLVTPPGQGCGCLWILYQRRWYLEDTWTIKGYCMGGNTSYVSNVSGFYSGTAPATQKQNNAKKFSFFLSFSLSYRLWLW